MKKSYISVVLLATVLSACGGGGGGTPPTTTPTPAPTPTPVLIPVPDSPVGRASYLSGDLNDGDGNVDGGTAGLSRTFDAIQQRVSGLYSGTGLQRYSGKGKSVAIWETGLQLYDDAEFAGRPKGGLNLYGHESRGYTEAYVRSSRFALEYCKGHSVFGIKRPDKRLPTSGNCGSGYTKTKNPGIHKLKVSSVVAGATNGIASEADIYTYDIGFSPGAFLFKLEPSDTSNASRTSYVQAYSHARNRGVLAINNSYTTQWVYDGDTYDGCVRNFTQKRCDDDVVKGWKGGLLGVSSMTGTQLNSLKNMLTRDYNTLKTDRYSDYRNNPIMVYATGNDGVGQASINARLGYHFPEVRWFFVSVSAITSWGQEASFSNRCGVAKYYCMTALGTGVSTTTIGDDRRSKNENSQGTSFSTPQVTGAFAMVGEKFPSLSVQEIRYRLLYTARHELRNGDKLTNREGDTVTPTVDDKCVSKTGCSDEFGNGTLRLDLAMETVGKTRLATSGTTLTSARMEHAEKSNLDSSGAFGSGFKTAFYNRITTVYDDLNAPFYRRLSGFVGGGYHNTYNALNTAHSTADIPVYTTPISHTSQNGLSYTHDGHATAHSMGFRASHKNSIHTIMGKHLHYTTQTDTWRMSSGLNPNTGTLMYGISRPIAIKNTTLRPLAKIMYEHNRILGAKGKATFGTSGNAVTTFLGIKAQSHIQGFDVYTYAHHGITRTRGEFGANLQRLDNITSRDMGMSVSRGFSTSHYNNRYGMSYTMPLRVQTADATMYYNTGRDDSKNLYYTKDTISVAPKGTARTMEAFYQMDSMDMKQSVRFTIIHNRDIHHTQGFNDTSVGAYYKIRF